MAGLLRTFKLPPTGWTLTGLLAFYVLAGLFGHDPWKTEDVIHIAVARDFLDPQHGLGLSLAGRPFFAPPLFYWSAALTGKLFGGFLPLHDALRLASGLWTALTLAALYYAGRALYGQESAAATPILLAGSFGLIVRAHEAQPMLILLAAIGIALTAACLHARKPGQATSGFAVALVLAALGAGLAGFFTVLPLLLLPLLVWRGSLPAIWPAFKGLLIALAVLAALDGVLNALAPDWLAGWLAHEWLLFSTPPHYFSDLVELLDIQPWFAWPLLPLAAWSLWLRRRQLDRADTTLPLIAWLLLFLVVPLTLSAKETTAILLLPPLALIATPGALALRRGAANAFDWFSGMAFSVFALLLWLGWSAMVLGWPERLARRVTVLEPGFTGRFEFLPFALALTVTLWWLWTLFCLPRSPYRCLTRWTAGLATAWLLTVSLWLPWIDYGKSYRTLAASLAAQIKDPDTCIAEVNLGDAQRASFAYFERLRFAPLPADGQTSCRWLLVQGTSRSELNPPGKGWQRVWEGNRPGDRRERFRLYRRETS